MIELLEHGREDPDDEKQPGRGAAALRRFALAAGAAALVGAAAMPVLGLDLPGGGGSRPRPTATPTPGVPLINSGDIGIGPNGNFSPAPPEIFEPGDHALLSTERGVIRADLRSGDVRRLQLPGWRPMPVAGRLLAQRSADVVVLAFPTGTSTGFDSTAYAVTPGAKRPEHLGWASAIVPAQGEGTYWLDRDVPGPKRMVQRVDGTGKRLAERRLMLWDVERVAAHTTGGLLVAPRFVWHPGPIEVRDPRTGARLARIAERGLVLDVRGNDVLWTRCRTCAPTLTVLGRGGPGPAKRIGMSNLRFAGSAKLAPDGRHVALVTRTQARSRKGWDVVLGHLPHDDRTGIVTIALGGVARPNYSRPPLLAWAPSGPLLVSDGRQVLVVDATGTKPPRRLALTIPPHQDLAAG
ncbi:MAG: hypothetical protein M3P48_11340 [Actinomycetota bacterium]|nr:hypothetical protein [Actinomycetota bacterium]